MQVLSAALTSDWLVIVRGYVGCRKLNALIKVPFRRGYFTVRLWIDWDIRVLSPVTGHLLYNQFPFWLCPAIWTIKKLETADTCMRCICSTTQTLRTTIKTLLHRRGWPDTAPRAVPQPLPSDNLACVQLFVSSKLPPSETTTTSLRLCNREGGFVFWKKQLFFRQRRSMERVHDNRNEKWKERKKGQEGAWIPFRFCSRHTCPRQARWLRTHSRRPDFEGIESYDERSDCLQELEQSLVRNTRKQRQNRVKHPRTRVPTANTARQKQPPFNTTQ